MQKDRDWIYDASGKHNYIAVSLIAKKLPILHLQRLVRS